MCFRLIGPLPLSRGCCGLVFQAGGSSLLGLLSVLVAARSVVSLVVCVSFAAVQSGCSGGQCVCSSFPHVLYGFRAGTSSSYLIGGRCRHGFSEAPVRCASHLVGCGWCGSFGFLDVFFGGASDPEHGSFRWTRWIHVDFSSRPYQWLTLLMCADRCSASGTGSSGSRSSMAGCLLVVGGKRTAGWVWNEIKGSWPLSWFAPLSFIMRMVGPSVLRLCWVVLELGSQMCF